jgi:hypothetical protein
MPSDRDRNSRWRFLADSATAGASAMFAPIILASASRAEITATTNRAVAAPGSLRNLRAVTPESGRRPLLPLRAKLPMWPSNICRGKILASLADPKMRDGPC